MICLIKATTLLKEHTQHETSNLCAHSDTDEDKVSSFVLIRQSFWIIKYQFLWGTLSYFLGKDLSSVHLKQDLYTMVVLLPCILFS